jgi:TrmH family RNA methyltransferase
MPPLDTFCVDNLVSTDNRKVKEMKSLNMKKKRDQSGLILLEGHRQIIDALDHGLKPTNVFLAENAALAPLGYDLYYRLTRFCPDCVYRVNDKIMKSVTDTVNTQGAIASFEVPEIPNALPYPKANSGLIVVLDGVKDPGNVGTLIRTAYAFNADAVLVAEGCDVWSPKVLRSSMGMSLRMPVYDVSWEQANELLTDYADNIRKNAGNGMSLFLADGEENNNSEGDGDGDRYVMNGKSTTISLTTRSEVYHQGDYLGHSVVVVGSEATGISDCSRQLGPTIARGLDESAGLRVNTVYVRIPTAHDLESLNAAVAGSILLSEVARQRSIA